MEDLVIKINSIFSTRMRSRMYRFEITHLETFFFFFKSYLLSFSHIFTTLFLLWKGTCKCCYTKDLDSFLCFFMTHGEPYSQRTSVVSCTVNTFWLMQTQVHIPNSSEGLQSCQSSFIFLSWPFIVAKIVLPDSHIFKDIGGVAHASSW